MNNVTRSTLVGLLGGLAISLFAAGCSSEPVEQGEPGTESDDAVAAASGDEDEVGQTDQAVSSCTQYVGSRRIPRITNSYQCGMSGPTYCKAYFGSESYLGSYNMTNGCTINCFARRCGVGCPC